MALRLRHQTGGASGRGEAVSKFSGRGSWEPTSAPGSPGSPLPVPPTLSAGKGQAWDGAGDTDRPGPQLLPGPDAVRPQAAAGPPLSPSPLGGWQVPVYLRPSPCSHPAWHFSFWEELPVWSLLQGMPPTPPALVSPEPPVARSGPGAGTVLAMTLGRGKNERVCPPDLPLRPVPAPDAPGFPDRDLALWVLFLGPGGWPLDAAGGRKDSGAGRPLGDEQRFSSDRRLSGAS